MRHLIFLLLAITSFPVLAGTWHKGETYYDATAPVFTPDGKHVIFHGGVFGSFGLYSITSGEMELRFGDNSPRPFHILIPDDSTAIVQYDSNAIYSYSLPDGEHTLLHPADSAANAVLAVHSNGRLVMASIAAGRNTVLWKYLDRADGTVLAVDSATYTQPLSGISLSPNGEVLAFHYLNSSVDFRRTDDGSLLSTAVLPPGQYGTRIKFSHSGGYYAVLTTQSNLYLYNTHTGKTVDNFPVLTAENVIAFYNNDSLLLVDDWHNAYAIDAWDIHTGQKTSSHSFDWMLPVRLATHPNLPLTSIVLQGSACTSEMPYPYEIIGIYDLRSGAIEQHIPSSFLDDTHAPSYYTSAAYTHAADIVAACSFRQRRTVLWDTDDGRVRGTVPTSGVISFAPNDSTLLVCNGDSMEVWNYRERTPDTVYYPGISQIKMMRTSLYNSLVALVDTSSIVLWDHSTGQSRFRWEITGDTIVSGLFDRWGERFIAGTQGGRVYSWDVQSGILLDSAITPNRYPAYHITADGRIAVPRNGLTFIDIKSGAVVQNIPGPFHEDAPYTQVLGYSSAFSPDGRYMYTHAYVDETRLPVHFNRGELRVYDSFTGELLHNKFTASYSHLVAVSHRGGDLLTLACMGYADHVSLPAHLVSVPPDQREVRDQMLSVVPNPSHGQSDIYLSLAQPGTHTVHLELYSLTGIKVATIAHANYEAGRHSIPFDTHSLPHGTYILRLTGTAGTATTLLIAE